MDDVDPTVPAHLRPVLGDAAERELEGVSDASWPADPERRAARREVVMRAAHVVDSLEAGCLDRQDVARLAGHAIGEQEPGRWPRTIEEADELIRRATLTRDLIQLRDMLGGRPTQAELDEPE